MSRTVSFKVYMTKAEDKSVREVRRFGIEVDVVTNFMYLREKIQTIFPSLRGKHFTICWKDADGDDITISSDEELVIAMNETATDNIRKIYILLHSEYPTQSNQGPVHVGITCDGCDSQVHGFRYKCVQCSDYDLCVECEGRGMHPEHCMIRLSVPLQWKPHMGKRLANHVNKFVKRAQPCKSGEDEEKRCPHRQSRHHGKSHHGVERSSWLDTFATYLDEWANLPGECPTKEPAKDDDAKKPNEQTKSSSASNESKIPRATETCPAEQLLKNVGFVVGDSFMTQILDPLINMHNLSGKTEIPTSTTSTPASPPSGNGDQSEAMVVDEPAVSTSASKFPGEGKKLRQTTITDEQHSSRDDTKESTEKSTIETELGWTMLNKNESPATSTNSGMSPSTGAVPKQVQSSAPLEESSKPIYPSLPMKQPTEEAEPRHPNPTIQKAVESMIQMGFTNNGGWLTNLLVSKSGDIAAALDALAPAHR